MPSPESVSIPSGQAPSMTPTPVPMPSPISVSYASGSPGGMTPMPVPMPSPISVYYPSGSPSGMPGNGTSPSAASSMPPQVTTAGASPSFSGDSLPFKLAFVVSGMALVGASLLVL